VLFPSSTLPAVAILKTSILICLRIFILKNAEKASASLLIIYLVH